MVGLSRPQAVWRERAVGFLTELVREARDDDVLGLASQVAFNTVFAIPPFIIFLITVTAIVNKVVGVPIAANLEQFINANVPGDAHALMVDIVEETVSRVDAQTISVSAGSSLLLAIWGAGRGIGSLIEAFHRAYDIPDRRPFWRQQLLRIALTLVVTILIVSAFLLFLFGQRIGDWLAGVVGLGATFDLVWSLLRWPAAVLLALLVLDLLYTYGPCMEHHFQLFSPGSLAATGFWVLSVFGFKLYLALSDPGTAYGAAGSLIVLLLFLYVTAIFFILGAEINSLRLATRPACSPLPPQPVEAPGVPRARWRRATGLGAYLLLGTGTAIAGLVLTLSRRRGPS